MRTMLYRRCLRCEMHAVPLRQRCKLQIPVEIGQLLDLRVKDCRLNARVLSTRCGGEPLEGTARSRHRGSDHFTLTDQARGKVGCPSVLAGCAPENQGIATIFDDRL